MDYEGMMTSKETGERRTQVFYCHPYRSNERGTNENQNRMFRRFFPKGTDLDAVPDEDISAVQDWMNNYPRKESPYGNIRAVRERGMDAFIKEERAEWTCEKCGGVVSVHTGTCTSCGPQIVPKIL